LLYYNPKNDIYVIFSLLIVGPVQPNVVELRLATTDVCWDTSYSRLVPLSV